MQTPPIRLVLTLTLLLIGACESPPGSTPAGADQPALRPRPTEHLLESDAESQQHKADRKAWIEELHRSAPDVDWRAIEQANGEREQERRNRLAALPFDGPGVWSEVGSQNQAGRMHCAALSEDGTSLYAGSSLGGVWRGNLDGTGWTPLGDNLYGGAHEVVVLPGEFPGVFVGAGEPELVDLIL